LYGGEHGSKKAEEVGPAADMGGKGVNEDDGAEQSDDEKGYGDAEDENGFFPGRHVGILLFVCDGLGTTWKKDEEE